MRIPYQPEEDEIIRRLFPTNATHKVAALIDRTPSSVAQRAEVLGLSKDPEYLARDAYRFNGQHVGGIEHRFKPGQAPPNKGKPMPASVRAKCAPTMFKKGRPAHEARNYQPIGTLRISKDGYLERKVTDDHPVPARRWVGVHRLVWEAANGPVPTGHVVVFMPGRRTASESGITLDALELVTRAELMRRNTRHRFPKELADLIALRASLTRKINNKNRKRSEAQQS